MVVRIDYVRMRTYHDLLCDLHLQKLQRQVREGQRARAAAAAAHLDAPGSPGNRWPPREDCWLAG